MIEFKFAREMGHLLESQFEADQFDAPVLLQHLGGAQQTLTVQPFLRALAKGQARVALQLAARNVELPA